MFDLLLVWVTATLPVALIAGALLRNRRSVTWRTRARLVFDGPERTPRFWVPDQSLQERALRDAFGRDCNVVLTCRVTEVDGG